MTNPYRALCAELVDSLENARRIIQGADGTLHINTAEFVLRRARALLAEPEAEGPSLKEQALEALQFVDEKLDLPLHNHCFAIHTIRRALKALPNDQDR